VARPLGGQHGCGRQPQRARNRDHRGRADPARGGPGRQDAKSLRCQQPGLRDAECPAALTVRQRLHERPGGGELVGPARTGQHEQQDQHR